MKRCNICIEEACKDTDRPYECDCRTCKQIDECDKSIRPTIRVTTKCTQACTHCCFSCSPEKDDHMSVDVARKISQFINNTPDILSCNLMGGELICNPDWKQVIHTILQTEGLHRARIVSNGDWVVHEQRDEFLDLLESFKDKIKVAISDDEWHTNKNVKKALQLMSDRGIHCMSDAEAMTEEAIVPIGRAELSFFGPYSMFGTYCQGSNKYQIMIDEKGAIYKCAMGIWNYADVDEYVDGGFDERFKEFHQAFHGVFIGSCSSCIRSHSRNGK